MDIEPINTHFPPSSWQAEQIPGELDGSMGVNRAAIMPWITAKNDSEAIHAWLHPYHERIHTYRSYKKEALRILLWAVLERKKPLSSLLADDFTAYFEFLADPPAHWVGTGRTVRGSSSWKPLRAPLTAASIHQAKIILNTMMSWLVSARYLSGNPISILRSTLARQSKKPNHYLRLGAWQFLWQWLLDLPEESKRQQQEKIRNQVLMSIFYLTAARLSDVAQAVMGDLSQDDFGHWWWEVVGKGEKLASIPITLEMMGWISAYRIHYQLPALPSQHEQTPLLFRINNPTGERLSANMIYRIVKKIMLAAGDAAELQQLPEIAGRLKEASTHWLRHTSLTHQAMAGMDVLTIRDNARHESISTTSRYFSTEDQLRHQQTSDKFKLHPGERQ